MTSTAIRTTVTEVTTSTNVAILSEDINSIIAEYAQAKLDIKALETKKKNAEEAIRAALGEAKVGYINGVKRVELKDRTLTKVDRKILQEAYPDAYAASLATTSYTVLDAE